MEESSKRVVVIILECADSTVAEATLNMAHHHDGDSIGPVLRGLIDVMMMMTTTGSVVTPISVPELPSAAFAEPLVTFLACPPRPNDSNMHDASSSAMAACYRLAHDRFNVPGFLIAVERALLRDLESSISTGRDDVDLVAAQIKTLYAGYPRVTTLCCTHLLEQMRRVLRRGHLLDMLIAAAHDFVALFIIYIDGGKPKTWAVHDMMSCTFHLRWMLTAGGQNALDMVPSRRRFVAYSKPGECDRALQPNEFDVVGTDGAAGTSNGQLSRPESVWEWCAGDDPRQWKSVDVDDGSDMPTLPPVLVLRLGVAGESNSHIGRDD
jgi:hypothetical protein